MASRRRGTLYVGVTGWLLERVTTHRSHDVPGFTATYRVDRLVWYEAHESFDAAIRRETCIKRWNRAWKIALVERVNPHWRDLYADIIP